MDTFLAQRVGLLVDFYEAEASENHRRNEADIHLLKSEVERLTNENRRLKEELSIRTSQPQGRIPTSSTTVDKPARSRNSPVKAPRNSNKSPEEAENSEPHANTIPAPKRTKVQNTSRTSISNHRSTRTRTKNNT